MPVFPGGEPDLLDVVPHGTDCKRSEPAPRRSFALNNIEKKEKKETKQKNETARTPFAIGKKIGEGRRPIRARSNSPPKIETRDFASASWCN